MSDRRGARRSWPRWQAQWQGWPASVRHACRLAALGGLLAAGALVVYLTGGTRYAYPYLMLLPVLLAAAWYGLAGSLAAALVAGLAMAAMPLEVASGEPQGVLNWLIRLGLYLLIGGFAGWLFSRLHHIHREHDMATRTDPRTGLANPVALEEDLTRVLAELRQGGKCVGLLQVRIADIAEILEALGADASDELVAAMGQRLSGLTAVRGLYRVSGAELMVLLESVDRDGLERVATRVVALGEENLLVQGVPLRVQLVMGSSLVKRNDASPGELIREARVALQAAVEKQRSHCHFRPELTRESARTVRLIAQVRRGLENGEFELHYQPKLCLADNRLRGCEALIRWRDDRGALIPPGLFMPKVENTTLIAPVTRFVVDEACRFARRHGESVSINVSARNLQDPAWLDELETLVERIGVHPSQLEVEITETALMQDMVTAKQALERLRGLGIGVSIDDFGTGFASFEYLRHLPITGLKIDRAFVDGLEQDPRARKLMACLIDVGHALDLVVTAEGVETRAQHRILRDLGCDLAQGFLYTQALPQAELIAWQRRHALQANTPLSYPS